MCAHSSSSSGGDATIAGAKRVNTVGNMSTGFAIQEGIVHGTRFVPSPNANKRPAATEVSLLVLHNISLPAASFGGDCVQALFQNTLDCNMHPSFASLAGVTVSAHLFIRRNGAVLQFVNLDERAWHAGESSFAARPNCNDYSIGIELEGCDHIAYTRAQYTSLIALTRVIMAAYPAICSERIVGHSDIAPLRKTDPGPAFDWRWYQQQLIIRTRVA